MRDLTEEEFNLAPEGFKEYGFNNSGGLFFFDRERGVAVMRGVSHELKLSKGHYAFRRCLPIPAHRKPFNVSEHEFGDLDLSACKDDGSDDLQIYVAADGFGVSATMYRQDVIAMAKALGVTAKDLA